MTSTHDVGRGSPVSEEGLAASLQQHVLLGVELLQVQGLQAWPEVSQERGVASGREHVHEDGDGLAVVQVQRQEPPVPDHRPRLMLRIASLQGLPELHLNVDKVCGLPAAAHPEKPVLRSRPETRKILVFSLRLRN